MHYEKCFYNTQNIFAFEPARAECLASQKRVTHLHDTVISTFVAGITAASGSKSARLAMFTKPLITVDMLPLPEERCRGQTPASLAPWIWSVCVWESQRFTRDVTGARGIQNSCASRALVSAEVRDSKTREPSAQTQTSVFG